MQVGIDVTCMHSSFGGRDFFGFGDMATFQKWPIFKISSKLLAQLLLMRTLLISVTCVCYKNGRLVTGSWDSTVKVHHVTIM